jgi:hypothetical protein
MHENLTSTSPLFYISLLGFILNVLMQGWEETVNASVTFLLKTTLAKTAKEGTSSLSGTTLEVSENARCLCS